MKKRICSDAGPGGKKKVLLGRDIYAHYFWRRVPIIAVYTSIQLPDIATRLFPAKESHTPADIRSFLMEACALPGVFEDKRVRWSANSFAPAGIRYWWLSRTIVLFKRSPVSSARPTLRTRDKVGRVMVRGFTFRSPIRRTRSSADLHHEAYTTIAYKNSASIIIPCEL